MSRIVYVDGQYVDEEEAKISVFYFFFFLIVYLQYLLYCLLLI